MIALPITVLLVGAVVLFAGGGGGTRQRGGPPVHHVLRPGFERGANVTAYVEAALAGPRADAALVGLRRLGADAVTFPLLWFEDARDSAQLAPDRRQTPSDRSVLHAMAVAHVLGMRVTLTPIVSVRDGTFRGMLAPSDRAAWFHSYRRMLGHYANLARRGSAVRLVVGSELTSMTGDTAAWQNLIRLARSRFGGQLTFAANWVAGAEQIGFWPSLDAIGVDAYMPLTASPDPPTADLRAAWQPWIARLGALHQRTRRPVVVTEFGFPSRLGAAARPSVEGSGPIDQAPQARAIAAALDALGHQPWITGAFVWDWSAEGREPSNGGGYSPQGKQAQTVLGRFWR